MGVGVVPQEFNFGIFEKVYEIVISQAGYYGIPRAVAAENAEKYLLALNEEKKVKADEYIKKAPDLTMTKLRKRINESYA